jgi:hypothetical protein
VLVYFGMKIVSKLAQTVNHCLTKTVCQYSVRGVFESALDLLETVDFELMWAFALVNAHSEQFSELCYSLLILLLVLCLRVVASYASNSITFF